MSSNQNFVEKKDGTGLVNEIYHPDYVQKRRGFIYYKEV